MELYRSFIFVPGNRENMLERAKSFKADVIVVDLEDSVHAGGKTDARELAKKWVPILHQQGQRVIVRVNSLDTGLTRTELEALVSQTYTASAWARLSRPGTCAPLTAC